MELNHRKLKSSYECLSSACNNNSPPCSDDCSNGCPTYNINCNSAPPPASSADDNAAGHPKSKAHHPKVPDFLVITISFLAATFFFLCCYAICRYFSARRRRRSQQQRTETGDDLPDEDQGPVNLIDHPIWYIRTTGLQQSIIAAITVCKYKRGEGLIDGTECSVCLSEFQEDENLRLLPKCNHAFHLPCIDTWLRSHTNCPICRAPIVVNPAMTATEPGVADSSSVGSNRQMEIVGNSGDMNGELEENRDAGLRNQEEEEEGDLGEENGRRTIERSNAEVENIQPRRSISLDSSSAARINLALSAESDGNLNPRVGGNGIYGKRVTENENLATTKGSSSSSRRGYSRSEGSSMRRSRSYHGKNLVSSWYGRSQRKPSLPVRSF